MGGNGNKYSAAALRSKQAFRRVKFLSAAKTRDKGAGAQVKRFVPAFWTEPSVAPVLS